MSAGPRAVSVAIPAYNQEAYIAEALESVLAQDYPALQIVVGDDGSADRTPAIVEDYRRRHPGQIEFVRGETNRGITANCNAILAACEGEFVAWLGGDDLFKPDKVAAQVRAFEARPDASVCHHPVEWFNGETGETISIVRRGKEAWHDADELIKTGAFGSSGSVMHRRDAAPAHGFRSEMRFASDWLFLIEVALAGEVVVLDEPLGRYRHHSGQVSVGRPAPEIFLDSLRTLEILEEESLASRQVIARGRANVLHWEAINRMRLNAARGEVRALLAHGLRADPTFLPLWRRAFELYVGAANMHRVRALKSRFRGDAGQQST